MSVEGREYCTHYIFPAGYLHEQKAKTGTHMHHTFGGREERDCRKKRLQVRCDVGWSKPDRK